MTSDKIEEATQSFWKNCVHSLTKDEPEAASRQTRISLQFKIQLEDDQFRSISKLQIVSKQSDVNNIITLFISIWSDCNDYYHSYKIKNIVFSYKILYELTDTENFKYPLEKLLPHAQGSRQTNSLTPQSGVSQIYDFQGKTKFPNTLDLNEWGEVLLNNQVEAIIKKKDDFPGAQNV